MYIARNSCPKKIFQGDSTEKSFFGATTKDSKGNLGGSEVKLWQTLKAYLIK